MTEVRQFCILLILQSVSGCILIHVCIHLERYKNFAQS